MSKIEQFHHANQFLIIDFAKNGNISSLTFQSYDSIIAVYFTTSRLLMLTRRWDFSQTTLKHLYMFIEERTFCEWKVLFQKTKQKRKFIKDLLSKNIISLNFTY